MHFHTPFCHLHSQFCGPVLGQMSDQSKEMITGRVARIFLPDLLQQAHCFPRQGKGHFQIIKALLDLMTE